MTVPSPYRSKLQPFEVEIAAMRQKRPPTPYREIVRILKERHGLCVQVSTLASFVKVRSKGRLVYALPPLRSRQDQVDNGRQDGRSVSLQSSGAPCSKQRASSAAPLADHRVPARTNQSFLKTFIPGNEYNLTRVSPEEREAFERELDRQIELERQQKEPRPGE
jgi:hypothetical protein